jgi:hypothetical protein
MSELEQGFRDALRGIDVLDAPVAPLDADALVARGAEHARRRRVRTLLVAAMAALVAVAIGLAGFFAIHGQAGPTVVGVPAPPASPRGEQLVVSAASAEPGVAEVVLTDPNLAKRDAGADGPTAFDVAGDSVYIGDSKTHQIYVYRDSRSIRAVTNPMQGNLIDLVVRGDTWYLVAQQGLQQRLGAYTLQGSELVAADVLPRAAAEATDVLGLVVDGESLVAELDRAPWVLLDGPGPVPARPTIDTDPGHTDVVVQVSDSRVRIRTRYSDPSSGTAVPQVFVYEFATSGQLVATVTCPNARTWLPSRSVTVVDGQVYALYVTSEAAQVLKLVPTPAAGTGTTATPGGGEALPDGFRWVGYITVDTGQRVRLAVPSGWGRGSSPSRDYCFRDRFDFPDTPYVDDDHGLGQSHAITCADLKADRQALHVTITDPSAVVPGPPWDGGTPGWRQWSSTVEGVVVTVTGRASDEALARRILATVTVSS